MELIPGLPDDVGRDCLIRVPYDHFSSASSVCRRWKAEIQHPDFFRSRKSAGCARSIVVMAQARVDPAEVPSSLKHLASPAYRLTLCDPGIGSWHELPAVPGFAGLLPMFCRIVGVGSDLVVMGGWDPTTWEVSNAVFIYNFVSTSWRRGADMPGRRRSFFGCASDSRRAVFVAGGHDEEKNALRSALAYDVPNDEWTPLPDMECQRDECKGLFRGGKFHVIGGYTTEMQGRFERSAEAFDVTTWHWYPPQADLLEANVCPRTCVDGSGGKLYMCLKEHVAVFDKSKGQEVAELPADVCRIACTSSWEGRLLVIGSARIGGPHSAYILDLKDYKWTSVTAPVEYSGHVQSACCLEI
ncbi:F-box/kelch-repeat protein At1g15670 [Malania oleifera]|uniref:F-box/kelch-repeat protein At1g15670 n=1 Tax=Malania oleifera TaxID=397392 RepID=UPI0025AE4675|nr:F-box/kelch-repeat protein At1g15670 [Malania oleifera]